MADLQEQLTTEAFNQLFEKFYSEGNNYVDSYLKSEEYHKTKYGHYRYSSYESFRNVRKNLLFGK